VISIVIPTLNETSTLEQTMAQIRARAARAEFEIIVSDCSSDDDTALFARSLGAKVVSGATCRADACNRGAASARGDVLLFLHADTLLPEKFDHLIEQALMRRTIVGGAFNFAFSGDASTPAVRRMQLRLVMLCNHIRYRWSRNFYGDQAMFVRRAIFDAVGGFPMQRLLEDVHFSRLMNRMGRTAILAPPVLTSPRRFLSRGVLRQLLHDMYILSCDSFGHQPGRTWEHYNHWNRHNFSDLRAGRPLAVR
jgi:rSAM/selenodomain-associated transferase 2